MECMRIVKVRTKKEHGCVKECIPSMIHQCLCMSGRVPMQKLHFKRWIGLSVLLGSPTTIKRMGLPFKKPEGQQYSTNPKTIKPFNQKRFAPKQSGDFAPKQSGDIGVRGLGLSV